MDLQPPQLCQVPKLAFHCFSSIRLSNQSLCRKNSTKQRHVGQTYLRALENHLVLVGAVTFLCPWDPLSVTLFTITLALISWAALTGVCLVVAIMTLSHPVEKELGQRIFAQSESALLGGWQFCDRQDIYHRLWFLEQINKWCIYFDEDAYNVETTNRIF